MIRLTKATFYREAEVRRQLAEFILRADELSMGSECEAFEHAFAQKQERRHCIMVNSGSSANLALVQALLNLGRLSAGDQVGFSALTWSTNVMPLIELGLRAVPIDIELETLNVSSRLVAAVLDRFELRMVLLTDLLGWCDDIEKIRELCAARDVLLVEDACEALGSVYRGTRLGNFGLASTFSFYVGHQFSTIEGGAVCTDDDDLANMLRIVRAHGWDRNLNRTTQSELREQHDVASTFYSRYTFYHCGYNLRPTEIAGFLGNVSLPFLDEIVQRRQENYRLLSSRLYAMTDRYLPLRSDHLDVFSNFALPIICRSKQLHEELVRACEGRIELRPIVGGDMTKQPFFRRSAGTTANRETLPNADAAHARGLYIGNRPDLEPEELDEILSVFGVESGADARV